MESVITMSDDDRVPLNVKDTIFTIVIVCFLVVIVITYVL